MSMSFLELPARTAKPRTSGLTMVIDHGLGPVTFEDQLRVAADHVDLVKFGWGTALVTPQIERKIAVAHELGIRCYLGGTLFEKCLAQDRVEEYLELCRRLRVDLVEVSNGTLPLSNTAKATYIRKASEHFEVVSEVGYKDSDRSLHFSPSQWVDAIEEDFEAGAVLVTTEARESGRSGICRPDGEIRYGLIEDIIGSSKVEVGRLLFEAPTRELQAYFISLLGPNVNLGNIAPDDAIGVETLRLGLRADTFMDFEEQRRA